MDRHPRSPAARGVALAAALVLAGCGGDASLRVQGQGVPPPTTAPGTSSSGGSLSAHVHGFGALRSLLVIGGLVAVYRGSERAEPVPVLDPARVVNEQDCSRPIADPGANLRCR